VLIKFYLLDIWITVCCQSTIR